MNKCPFDITYAVSASMLPEKQQRVTHQSPTIENAWNEQNLTTDMLTSLINVAFLSYFKLAHTHKIIKRYSETKTSGERRTHHTQSLSAVCVSHLSCTVT